MAKAPPEFCPLELAVEEYGQEEYTEETAKKIIGACGGQIAAVGMLGAYHADNPYGLSDKAAEALNKALYVRYPEE